MSDELESLFAEPAAEPDWSERAGVIGYSVEGQRPFAGSYPFDERGLQTLVGRVVDRTVSIASNMTSHWIIDGGKPVRPRLGKVRAPTLVLHAPTTPCSSPATPKRWPERSQAHVCAARMSWHKMPPRPAWNRLVPAILATPPSADADLQPGRSRQTLIRCPKRHHFEHTRTTQASPCGNRP